MYATDRGLDDLADARGEEQVVLGWVVERLREFADLHPEHAVAMDRFAGWLSSLDDEE